MIDDRGTSTTSSPPGSPAALPSDPAPATASKVRRWPLRLAAVAAGAIVILAFPASDQWWLAFVGLVPIMGIVIEAPTRREAMVRAWLGGVGFFAAAYSWLVPSVGIFTIVLVMVFGLWWVPWGVVAWTVFQPPRGFRRMALGVVLVPCTWVAVEYARSAALLGGPWDVLGAALWSTRLGAIASIGGVWLTSLALVAVNTALLAAVLARPWQGRLAGVATAAVVVVAMLAYGTWRPPPTPAGVLRVAGVQPGWIDDTEARFDADERLTRTLTGQGIGLIVWGESSVGYDLDTDPAHLARLEQLAGQTGAELLVNVDAERADGSIAKTAELIGPTGIDGRYDKTRLVPFGEYVPFRSILGWVPSITQAAKQDRRPGPGPVVLTTSSGARLGPLICFESTFPDMSRAVADDGADLVVVQTATTTFQGTWAQPQQASLAAVRAVESGRPVVNAAVSGVSAIVDSRGHQLAELGSTGTGTYVADVPLDDERTPFDGIGDIVPWLAMAVTAGAIAAAVVLDVRRRGRVGGVARSR
jgi:apolipoprotein N-acyltransferase